MKTKRILFIALFILVIPACKEKYFPTLDEIKSSLVVSALITDEPGTYSIRLSKAIPFNGSGSIPVEEANVHLVDNHGNSYYFYETIPGTYDSDPSQFIPQYGTIYTLVIQTKDQKGYRSSPQVLYPKGTMDTIRSVLKYETLTTYFGEGAKLSSIRGAEFVSDINLMSDPSPYYRFSNALILEYFTQYVYFSSGAALPKYCWIKYTPYAALNLSERHSSSDKTQQILGFCPLETDYYGVQTVPIMAYNNQTGKTDQIGNIKRTPFKFIFTIKQYHLNSDVYLYYKAVNDQLAANQQILDPISVQTVGNIICTTNPEEHVLGVFEVASINIHTYSYDALNTQFGIEVNSVPVIDPAEYSDGDCYIDNPPNFWLK